MTPLEYMEKQAAKHRRNLEREASRDVPTDMVYAILAKVHYYEAAVEALKKEGSK